jgi:hypothetical protein
MPDGVTVKVRNKDKLARKLRQLAPEALKALTAANYETADEMVATAQRYVPYITGTLHNSIHTEPGPPDTGAVRVVAGGSPTTKGGYDYALGVEFGTSDTTAEPYFFPSYRLGKRSHKRRVTRAMKVSSQKVAKS